MSIETADDARRLRQPTIGSLDYVLNAINQVASEHNFVAFPKLQSGVKMELVKRGFVVQESIGIQGSIGSVWVTW